MVTSVAFSPDGLTCASTSADGIQVWEAATGQHITTLAGPPNFSHALTYLPEGARLATGSVDARDAKHTLKLWEVETGKNIATLQGHTDGVATVACSRNGTLLASGSKDKTVRLWEVETEKNIATLQGHGKMVSSVAFSPDGTKLASGSQDTSIRLWEIPTGKALYTIGGVNSPQIRVEVLPVPRPGQDISELQIDNDVDSEAEIIRDWVQSVAFSPDGTKLASVSYDMTVRLWDVLTQKHITTLIDEHYSVWSAVFSPDGTKLAVGTGTGNHTVELWEVSTQKHIATFPGHTGNVYTVAFSPDGTKLASGSFDGTVLLWDVSESIKRYPSKQHSD